MIISTTRIAHWLGKLVQIPSVNPAGHEKLESRMGEGRMAEFLAEQFAKFGGRVELDEVFPQRPNVYAYFEGKSDKLMVVDAHMDTVDVTHMTDPPFDGRVEDGRVWGRGAVDTKATHAIMLALVEQLYKRRIQPQHNLLVIGTVSEEYGGYGAKAFAEWVKREGLHINQMMVAEPTLCAPIYAHKGVMGGVIHVHGRAAHSSTPDEGANAITAAAKIVLALDAEHQRLQQQTATTALGNGVLSVTVINGGSGHNIIPDHCQLILNRRLTAFEEPQAVAAHLEQLIVEASPLPVTVELRDGMPALYQEPDSKWVQDLAAWTGQTPAVAPYGTNALAYNGLAEDTVVFGPGSIDQAHKAQEWVTLAELEKAAEVYRRWLCE